MRNVSTKISTVSMKMNCWIVDCEECGQGKINIALADACTAEEVK